MAVRMLPPAQAGANFTTIVNGRTYTCSVGSFLDATDHDALVLEANGWVRTAQAGVATTTGRPTGLLAKDRGVTFHDTTLGFNIVWDGRVWRNPTSGAAV